MLIISLKSIVVDLLLVSNCYRVHTMFQLLNRFNDNLNSCCHFKTSRVIDMLVLRLRVFNVQPYLELNRILIVSIC